MFAATGDTTFRDKANKDIARSIPRPTMPAIVGAPGDPSQWLNLTDPKTLTFEAHDCGPASGLKFQPVHEIHHERLAVYLLKTGPEAPPPTSH